MALAWELRLKPTRKLVLMCLCDFADDHGYCWPSQSTIAHKCNVTTRQIRDHIQALQRTGLIDITERYAGTGARTSNAYQIHVDVLRHRATEGAEISSDGAEKISGAPEENSDPPGSPLPPNHQDPPSLHLLTSEDEIPLNGGYHRQPTSGGYEEDDPKIELYSVLTNAGWLLHQVHGNADVVKMVVGWVNAGVTADVVEMAVNVAVGRKGDLPHTPQYLRPIVDQLMAPEDESRGTDQRDSKTGEAAYFAAIGSALDDGPPS